jgi:hypothetical protein
LSETVGEVGVSEEKPLSPAAQEFRMALPLVLSWSSATLAALLFDQHTEGLREENERLEQKVCDFQAASMIDVAGQGGPCLVEPHHVESHVNELRTRLEAAESASAEYIRRTDPLIACGPSDDPTLGQCGKCRSCYIGRLEAAEKELADWKRMAQNVEATNSHCQSLERELSDSRAAGAEMSVTIGTPESRPALPDFQVSDDDVMTADSQPICPGCKKEIDPDVCGCGGSGCRADWDGHSFVPQGCDCLRVKDEDTSR